MSLLTCRQERMALNCCRTSTCRPKGGRGRHRSGAWATLDEDRCRYIGTSWLGKMRIRCFECVDQSLDSSKPVCNDADLSAIWVSIMRSASNVALSLTPPCQNASLVFDVSLHLHTFSRDSITGLGLFRLGLCCHVRLVLFRLFLVLLAAFA